MRTKILAGVLLVAAALAADAQQARERKSWYIGFGLGGGFEAGWTVDGSDITFDDWLLGLDTSPKIALNFKVGGTANPHLLVGFDVTACGQIGDSPLGTAQIQINNYFAMLTYFPMETGLFLRAGGGYSALVAIIDAAYGGGGDDTVAGFGFLAGAGYAFWLGRRFNLTLNIDHSRQYYSGAPGDPESSRFTIAYLGFDWY